MRWLCFALLLGCAGTSKNEEGSESFRVPRRHHAVVLEGCALDPWQHQTLSSVAARKVLREVVMLCPSMLPGGRVTPSDSVARASLSGEIAKLHGLGYQVTLAVRAADDTGAFLSGSAAAELLTDALLRGQYVTALAELAREADGIDLAFLALELRAAADFATFTASLSTAVRPKTVGLFAPPSVMEPSDLPDGDVYDLINLPLDRVRLMTLDFSCCGAKPGPTIDSGWAVDAARLARSKTKASLHVAYPLYGWDFSAGKERPVTYFEARGVAAYRGLEILRGPTGAPHFGWTDASNNPHELWFDDRQSTLRALEAWRPDVLPPDVGVTFYGLGAEDPALFPGLAESMP